MGDALRSVLARFGFEIDDSKLTDAIKRTDTFVAQLKTATEKIIGGSLKEKVGEWIDQVKEAAGEFKGISKLTGMSVQDAQKWTTAAKLAGVDAETLAKGFLLLQKGAAGAAGGVTAAATATGAAGGVIALGGAEAAAGFKALGVEVKDKNGQIKETAVLMREVGLKLGAVKNPSERSALAMKLFGEQGTKLLPLFAKGEKGLDELLGKLDELGGGVSDEALAALAAQSQATKQYDIATLSLKSALAAELLPAMTAKIQALTKVFAWLNKAVKGTYLVKSAVIILGAAMAWQGREAIAAGLKTALAYAPVILTVAGLVLLLDDLITFFKGGKSAFGDLVTAVAGKEITGAMQKDIDSLGKRLDKLPDWGDKVEEVFSTVGASLVAFFVDDIPEAAGFFWKDLQEWGGKAWEGVKNFFSRFADAWLYGVGQIGHFFKDLGLSIVTGLIDGLDSAWDWLKSAVKALGDKIKNAFKEFWDAHSPSRVMRADTRIMLGGGMVYGLKDAIPEIEAQARETFAAAMLPAGDYTPRIGFGGGAGGDVINQNTIQQRNEITIDASGGDKGTDTLRQSVSGALKDDRAAALAALETVGGED